MEFYKIAIKSESGEKTSPLFVLSNTYVDKLWTKAEKELKKRLPNQSSEVLKNQVKTFILLIT